MRVTDLVKFINARERHRKAKEAHRRVENPDPIISQYRFCNVRRNDDRVTKWIHEKYLRPWILSDDLWFALLVARLFNNEMTLADISDCVLPFDAKNMARILARRSADGHKNFNAAYIVSTNGHTMEKVQYLMKYVLEPAWRDRKRISKALLACTTLAEAHKLLSTSINGLGSFMAAQVLADLKYALPERWSDFSTFAASGPGSKRGLNRVLKEPTDSPWREAEFRDLLLVLRDRVNARLKMDPLTAQDIQNCLCEFDKYERARLGEGRPKQFYKPKGKLPWDD
jgi:hypothetical protein